MQSGAKAPRELAIWLWHQQALHSLGMALEAFESIGVQALVVKGMVLAYSLHGDVVDRPMSDVDLRVRPRDLVRAAHVLGSRGFLVDWTSRQLGAVAFRIGGVLVELEASIGPPGICGLSVSRMMARSGERVLPGGLRVREPELHDHAVLLVVNAFKDKFFGAMPWALDDLGIIAKRVDIDTFLDRVREARLRTMTWMVADWMARERGSVGWQTIRTRLGDRPPRPLYARALRRFLERRPSSAITPALARIASDSVPMRGWALLATGMGLVVQSVARRL